MAWRVFIDGEAGTTGLQIRERLAPRADITLIEIAPEARKDLQARLKAYAEADVAILCLPDTAVLEIAPEALKLGTRLIDASTAHRTADNWVFGYPELDAERRGAIAQAQTVSNPGCYATGAIALLAPLLNEGLIAPDQPLSINAISGFSGGGKAMIAEFEADTAGDHFVYALTQAHKHVPEIMRHGGLSVRPVFSPSVGRFQQGMLVQVPLHLGPDNGLEAAEAALRAHYAGQHFVTVRSSDSYEGRVSPTALNGTNRMELSVHGNPASGHAVAMAVLDNLGKGASGAAVQSLNIMLGLDEATGLN
jgi:N-acetyl-gamma-glutamyl-phosphate reductase